jgi:glycosyltransferase involved in cell wall biosynthesis
VSINHPTLTPMDEKKRVAIFALDVLPISQTFIRDQAEALTSWEPVLIGRRSIDHGLETPDLQREIVTESGGRLAQTLRYWFWHSDPKLTKRFRQLKIRLVHAHFGIGAIEAWPSVKAAGLPMLVTLHGIDINVHRHWWEAGHAGLRLRLYPRRLLRMAHEPSVRFLAVSESIKRRAIEYGIPEHKVTVSYIGVDTARFRPAGLPIEKRRMRILYVGRMTEKKAPLLMIQAFASVKKQMPEAELVMIGAGPLLEDAKQLALSLHLPVDFRGAQSATEVLEQLHQARVFCLPSITANNGDAEGLPISILEAMACGVPVVTSANGADDILRGDHCLVLIKQGDTHALSSSIIRLLSDRRDATAISQRARRTIETRFSLHQNVKSLENEYNQAK